MSNIILIILYIFAGVYLCSIFILNKKWKSLDGEEVKVSSISRSVGMPDGEDYVKIFSPGVRLFGDRVVLKAVSRWMPDSFQGKFREIKLTEIEKVVRKSNFLQKFSLEIHTKGVPRYYKIFANEDNINKLVSYFNSHNIQFIN
jgi:hypothetical protein